MNLTYSNKGGLILNFITQGINEEISSSLRHASNVFINERLIEIENCLIKGFLQIIGIVALQ
jgi:hypothetical protein